MKMNGCREKKEEELRVRVAVLRLTTEVVVSPQTDRQSQHKHLYLLAESQFVNPRP